MAAISGGFKSSMQHFALKGVLHEEYGSTDASKRGRDKRVLEALEGWGAAQGHSKGIGPRQWLDPWVAEQGWRVRAQDTQTLRCGTLTARA